MPAVSRPLLEFELSNPIPFLIPPLILLVLMLDSTLFQHVLPHGQSVATVLTAAYFILLIRTLSPERRLIVLCFVFIGTVGECLFSLVFHLYEYRLGNIPIYVPLGHPLLLAFAWRLADLPWVEKHSIRLTQSLACIHLLIILLMLAVYGDTLSAAFGLLGWYLFRRRQFNIIYALMGLIVIVLELAGTALGCWHWHATSAQGWLASTNPPYGAFLGYVAADIASIKLARRISAQWFPQLAIASP